MPSDSTYQEWAEDSPEQSHLGRRPQRLVKPAMVAASGSVQAQKGSHRARSPVLSQGDGPSPKKPRLRATGRGAKGSADLPQQRRKVGGHLQSF